MNVRDLGGHPTEDGGETRFGAVVRADSVRQLSDDGWQALVDYGVRTVVDLRLHSELEADPPRNLPVEVVHVSLFGTFDPEVVAEIEAIAAAAQNTVKATEAVYLEFLERYRENFGRAIAAVAAAQDGGVCVHCAVGKDRTGLVTALLLRLAGVPPPVIAADYAVSAENLAAQLAAWIAETEDELERRRRHRLSATPAESMLAVLEELDRRYGGVREYLRAAGAASSELARARARLRD